MKRLTALFFAVILSIFVIPAVIPIVMSAAGIGDKIAGAEGDAVTAGSFSQPFEISVYDSLTGEIFNIEFEEYITGVVAGEVPPTYNSEAIKAQTVAARSYILSKVADFKSGKIAPEHNGAMVCTDYAHCQAYKSIQVAREGWNVKNADEYEQKIRSAVEQTLGEYMIYDNKVVKAYFCAMSNGKTENVEDVWGSALPYLKSVSSVGDIGAYGYESRVAYPKDLFVHKLSKLRPDIAIDSAENAVGRTELTEGGSVLGVEIGGEWFTGKEIRDLFDLRSTSFDIVTEGDKITFKVKGHGHGVGMSQNGANAMANEGKNYKEILMHYYSGVDIVNLYKKV